MVNGFMDEQAAALAREQDKSRNIIQTTEVYSVSRDITYGELLRLEDVKRIYYATENMPEGTFATEEELFPQGIETPRVVRLPMKVNEPILISKVTDAGAPRGVTALLDPGMRAYPLSNDLTSAFANDLRRSDRIDLYWVGNLGGRSISRLVKSGLEIVAMDEPDANGNGGGRNVVLQVSQADFADLRLLQTAGSLSLTPVARVDEEGGDTSIETDVSDALGIVVAAPEPVAAPVAGPKMCTRVERRGVDRVEITEPCEEQ
jgi:pilus assembly protein CpaB